MSQDCQHLAKEWHHAKRILLERTENWLVRVQIRFRHAKHYFLFFLITCSLNEALDKAQPNQPQNFQIFAPQMPLNTLPLCVALHVENQSETEKELKILKHLSCDCSMKKHRLRKDRMGVKCPHGSVVELRPAFCKIKAKGTVQLEMVVNYNLLGQQEIDFSIM